MSIATATVSIAPFPVPMQVDEPPPEEEVPPSLSECDIQARYGTVVPEPVVEIQKKPDVIADLEETVVALTSLTTFRDESTARMTEPEEARVMVGAELTELLQTVVKVEPLSPMKAVVPQVVRAQRQSAFSEFAKDLPPEETSRNYQCPIKILRFLN